MLGANAFVFRCFLPNDEAQRHFSGGSCTWSVRKRTGHLLVSVHILQSYLENLSSQKLFSPATLDCRDI